MQRPLTIVFSGGGTGGHLFPGIAVAEELIARDSGYRIVFAGSQREVEHDIVASHGYEHWALPVESSSSLFRSPHRVAWKLWRSYRVAGSLLRRERPACVVGLGGFASVPVALAARRLGIPIVLLEQNVVPGRATSLLSRLATSVCFSFPETTGTLATRPNARVTGNPVRRSIAALTNTSTDLSESSPPTLLILGGSQGAIAVNDATFAAARNLSIPLAGWRIVHQTGRQDAERVRRCYDELRIDAIVEPFFTDLVDWLRSASVVVSRAGATTLAELACAGCPTVLIPYPGSIGDHQRANARVFAAAGAARIVEQADSVHETAAALARQLQPLLVDATLRESMSIAMRALARPHAARAVADCVVRVATVPLT
ncbi:MAG: undecaprenyldiphospho-muramoylpentapeptide beta-N-acetylglucosaminyltransferase [Planctomycetaceae bacterium]